MAEKLEFIILAKDKFSGSFKKLTGYLPSVKMLALGAASGIAAAGAATFAMAKQTAEAHDAIQKFSDQIGASTDFISKMDVAAGFAAVRIETVHKAIQQMQVGIGNVHRGVSGPATQAFEDLGVSVYTVEGHLKSSENIMYEVADAINNLGSEAEKSSIAAKLFGLRGMEMLQLFTSGADGLRSMTGEAERFGVVISAKAGANAAAFNDALYRTQLALQGLRNYIAEQNMPMITGLANRFADFVADNRDKILEFAQSFVKSMGWIAEKGAYAVALLVDSWRGLKMIWEVLKISFTSLSSFLLTGINEITKKMLGFMQAVNVGGVFDGATARVQSFVEWNRTAIKVLDQTADSASANLFRLSMEKMAISRVGEFVDTVKTALAEIRTEGEAGPTAESLLGVSNEAVQRTISNVSMMTEAQKSAYQQLLEAHDEYYLSEEERLEEWYVRQAEMYAEHEEAKAILDEVYLARRLDLDNREREEKKRRDQAADALRLKQLQAREKAADTIQRVAGIRGFNLSKVINIKETYMATKTAAIEAYKAMAGIPIVGPILGAIAAAAAIAFGMSQVADIKGQSFGGAAHGGLDNVPKEQTYLLDRGERVLSPGQNRDLTDFMNEPRGPGIVVENLVLQVLPNATNPAALLAMDKQDWREVAEDKIVPAFRELNTRGLGL